MAGPWEQYQSAPAEGPWTQYAKKPPEVSVVDRANAVSTGFNRGAITRTLGLPVDTIANIGDLGKAAFGSVATAFGRPDLAPEVNSNRSSVVGSGDWIEQKLRGIGGGSLIDPSGPVDATTRVLHSAGMGLGGAAIGGKMAPTNAFTAPLTVGAQSRNMLTGLVGGGLGGVATENGASPAMSILASMGPQGVGAAAAGGAKLAVRGGEAGRQKMAQRIQDFKQAGVDNPSLGLASGNALVGGIENLLAKLPGSVGMYNDARTKMIAGMMDKAGQTRDLASTRSGADVTGAAIQADLQTLLKSRIQNGYEGLNNQVDQAVGNQTVPVLNSLATSGRLSTPIPGAEQTSSLFIQPRVTKINNALAADASASPQNGVPFGALKDLRTQLGKESVSSRIIGTPEEAQFKQIYGALTDDMKTGVGMVDLRNGTVPASPGSASSAFNRANDYYAAGMSRIDRVQPFVNKKAPEQAYNALMTASKENVSTVQAVKKSVSEETRASIAATTIDRMGKAKPGQQNEGGDAWSSETFLTNWNQISPKARKELLSGFPNAGQVYAQIEGIAKGASMLRDSSKVWANPSGTGGNLLAGGLLGGIATNALYNPLGSAAAVGGLVGARAISQNMLLNPKFTNYAAEAPKAVNQLAPLQSLIMNAQRTKEGR